MAIECRSLAARAGLAAASLALAVAAARLVVAPESTPRALADSSACDEPHGQIVTDSLASGVYDRTVPYNIYLPPCYDQAQGRLPVMVLLHGGADNESQWPAMGLAADADSLIASGAPPFLVVMPGGQYLQDLSYEAFVLRDLLPNVECRYPARGDAAGQTIGGVSLGGYWALRTAVQHPRQFAAAGGHSPWVDLGGPTDPLRLADTLSNTVRLPVMLDAGTEDGLFYGARTLARTLESNGLAVSFTSGPGGHESAYWAAHTRDYLSRYLAATTPALLPESNGPAWLTPPRACAGRFYPPGLS